MRKFPVYKKINSRKIRTLIFSAVLVVTFVSPGYSRRVKGESIPSWVNIRSAQTLEEKRAFRKIAYHEGLSIPILVKGSSDIDECIVAVDTRSGKVLGGFYYLLRPLSKDEPVNIELYFCVHPDFQQKKIGIGRAMSQSLLQRMKQYGISELFFRANNESRLFWEKMGARFVREAKFDLCIMSYTISDGE